MPEMSRLTISDVQRELRTAIVELDELRHQPPMARHFARLTNTINSLNSLIHLLDKVEAAVAGDEGLSRLSIASYHYGASTVGEQPRQSNLPFAAQIPRASPSQS